MHKVVVFGSLNMDMTIECDCMPKAGETITGRGFLLNPGGKGANQAVAAATMGGTVEMIGAVGNDPFGEKMVEAMAVSGIRCTNLAHAENFSTGVASITRCDGDNRIIVDPGANHALGHDEVCAALDASSREGDVFLVQLECDFDTTLASLASAASRGLFTVLNPAPARELPDEIWHDVCLACLNETECRSVTGVFPESELMAKEAARALIAKGVGIVIVTMGERGSVVVSADGAFQCTPPHVDAIDTTCAGDTYLGTLAACRAADMPLEDAVKLSTAASALATTRVGAQQSIPRRSEAEELVGACEIKKLA